MARIIQTADLTPDSPLTQTENDWIYNGLDTMVTLEVWKHIHPQLDNMTSGTYNFSRSLQGPILEMTMRGTLIDKIKRYKLKESQLEQATTLAVTLEAAAGDAEKARRADVLNEIAAHCCRPDARCPPLEDSGRAAG